MHLSIKSILLSILCAGLLPRGGEPRTGTAKEPAKVLVRERTVYVPYEKLKETFEKEGRGIFMPYEEFLKLWNAAQVKPLCRKNPSRPWTRSSPAAVTAAWPRRKARASRSPTRSRRWGRTGAKYFCRSITWRVETVSVSDPQAVLAPNGDGYSLHMPKPGEYTVTLAFAVRVNAKPGTRSIEFGIPPTAVSRLELVIPEKDLRVDVTPKMAATTTTTEGKLHAPAGVRGQRQPRGAGLDAAGGESGQGRGAGDRRAGHARGAGRAHPAARHGDQLQDRARRGGFVPREAAARYAAACRCKATISANGPRKRAC